MKTPDFRCLRFIFPAVILLLAGCFQSWAAPMKARVIQQLYAQDLKGLEKSFKWTLNELKKCDPSLDIIVIGENCHIPGKTPNDQVYFQIDAKNGPVLLKACAETARRCHSYVFAGALDSSLGAPRNTIFMFDRNGELVGKYYKEQLTPGEMKRLDKSYTEEWTKPYLVDIDGLRFAFLTCYDFYFYENFANIARWKPDIIIGCSHQRSDTFRALDIINSFCAYNTGAYLVRASVSMGLDSVLGGCSCVVSPTGEILGNLRSEVASMDITFDPKEKYLKPAGYGNPPAMHSEYIEKGRRPWKYRPAGSAIVTPFPEAPARRLCAHRGFSSVAPENSLAALGAAVALGAAEVEFDLWWTKDGEIVSIHDATLDRVSDGTGKVYEKTYQELLQYDFGIKHGEHFKGLKILRFEDILRKLSCHTIMNIHLKSIQNMPWDRANLQKVIDLIRDYDAQGHVYFMTNNGALHAQLMEMAPEIPRCMGNIRGKDIVDEAIRNKCQMVQLFKPYFDQNTIDRAKANGMRVNLFWSDDPEEAVKYLDMGVETILTNDYQIISAATGLK
ncbi:MAG: hypothetical protein IJM35_06935 [Bacteroidales bacterium]|nr:hypothetical protein [Bacteroidales bacterium]